MADLSSLIRLVCLPRGKRTFRQQLMTVTTIQLAVWQAVTKKDGKMGSALAMYLDAPEELVSTIMQEVVDLEYNSCTDDPELCHVRRDELVVILRRHIMGED